MSKTVLRPFGSFDVVKTENRLSEKHAKGCALKKVHFSSRLFVFEKTQPAQMFYRIIFDKHTNGAPEIVIQDGAYEPVCLSKKFYVLRTNQTRPTLRTHLFTMLLPCEYSARIYCDTKPYSSQYDTFGMDVYSQHYFEHYSHS